jgi:hypothetical protein
MAFKKKFQIFLTLTLLVTSFVYFVLADNEVANHKIKGRIVNIERGKLLERWTLTIFSDGRVYKMDIKESVLADELMLYNKKYVVIHYVELLFNRPFRSKYKLIKWESS